MEVKSISLATFVLRNHTEELCGNSFPKSLVSALCMTLGPAVTAFRERPSEKWCPFIMVDAIYTKVHEHCRICFKGLRIAIGLNEQGNLEVLGFRCAGSETEAGWTAFSGVERPWFDLGGYRFAMRAGDGHPRPEPITRCGRECFFPVFRTSKWKLHPDDGLASS